MVVFDVAIIGAGPAGSSAAKVVAENGYKVALIERAEYPGKANVCAGGLPRFIVEKLGLEDTIEKEIKADVIYLPWGIKKIRRKNVTVYRYVFDRKLAELAVEQGARLFTNTTITDVKIKDDFVLLNGNNNINIKSKMVIFADGPNTLAYRKFGIGFKPEADKTVVSVVCEVEYRDNPYDEFEMYANPDIVEWGYGWVFPKRNTVNIGIGCIYKFLRNNIIIDKFKFFLESYPPVSERFSGKKIVWLRAATIPACPANKIYGEKMLVVGDAAGMVDPISGGGIYHAIVGGVIAGETCVDALNNKNYSEKFLSRYQEKWFETINYRNIKIRYLISRIFMFMFKFDSKAYAKLMDFGYGEESKIKKILRLLTK